MTRRAYYRLQVTGHKRAGMHASFPSGWRDDIHNFLRTPTGNIKQNLFKSISFFRQIDLGSIWERFPKSLIKLISPDRVFWEPFFCLESRFWRIKSFRLCFAQSPALYVHVIKAGWGLPPSNFAPLEELPERGSCLYFTFKKNTNSRRK
jgi:hypothetical protein